MTAKDEFLQAWNLKFPIDKPPDLECFEVAVDCSKKSNGVAKPSDSNRSVSSGSFVYDTVKVHKEYIQCRYRIENLQKQLHQQEFLANFLYGLLGEDQTTGTVSTPTSTRANITDQEISQSEKFRGFNTCSSETEVEILSPINLTDTKNVTLEDRSACETIHHVEQFGGINDNSNNCDSVSVKDIIKTVGSSSVFNVQDSGVVKRIDQDNEQEHSAVIRSTDLVNICQSEVEKDCEQCYSLDSTSKLKKTSAPIINKEKIPLVKMYSDSDVKQRKPPVPSPRPSVHGPSFKGRGNVSEYAVPTSICHTMPDFNSNHNNSFKVKSGNKTTTLSTFGPPRLQKKQAYVNLDMDNQKILPEKELSKNSSTEREVREILPLTVDDSILYDEPIPVKTNQVEEEESSSDDEPIYYNILLLKKQSLDRMSINANKIYSNVDHQRKQVEQSAQRLSKRFSGPDNIGYKELQNAVALRKLETIGERKKIDGSIVQDKLCSPGISSTASVAVLGERSKNDANWKKTSSMYMATSTEVDMDDLDVEIPSCSDSCGGDLQMRKWVVTSILDSERAYVAVLDVLMQHMTTFRSVAQTQQMVIPEEDIDTIFSKIPELHRMHYEFIRELEPKIDAWHAEQTVAEPFKILALQEYNAAGAYLENYQRAIAAVHRCNIEYPQFQELTESIKVKVMDTTPSLEELLHKPVVRFQRNTLVLHDLIKCTQTSHADYDMLQKTLKIAQQFLDNFQSPLDKECADNQRYLAKQDLIVEKQGKNRKLRHIFLFNDVLVCAKQKMNGRHEVKWYIPLIDLMLIEKTGTAEEREIVEQKQQDVDVLQRRVCQLQSELKAELKKSKQATEMQRTWSFRGHTKNVDKIRRKLAEQESALVIASPHLAFRLKSVRQEKSHIFLMSSDYERMGWRETIAGLQNRVHSGSTFSAMELQNTINSLRIPRGSIDQGDTVLEEEPLFGSLDVTIHKLEGLKTPSDTFCCIEMDSFNHFFMKAKTRTICNSIEPKWNEVLDLSLFYTGSTFRLLLNKDFEIDLEGAQTLRGLCYKKDANSEQLIGKCALELSKAWLRGDFQEKTVSLNDEVSLTISLRYVSRAMTLKRTLSAVKGGLFGVRIAAITKRECTKIPLIVTTVVSEIEKRGIEDLGIYRVSGLSAEIQKLKKYFEKGSKIGASQVPDADVNVLTGLLKMYFRELPEALFMDKFYNKFVETYTSMEDPETKEKCMLSLLRSLPEPNFSTILYLIDHLVMVSRYVDKNKMTLENLATVFGPTLLRPAMKEKEPVSIDLFSIGARDAMIQAGILLFFLDQRNKGVDFRKIIM